MRRAPNAQDVLIYFNFQLLFSPRTKPFLHPRNYYHNNYHKTIYCFVYCGANEQNIVGCMTTRGGGQGRKAQLPFKGTLPALLRKHLSESSQLLGFREKISPPHRLVGIYRFFSVLSTFGFSALLPHPPLPGFVFNNVSAEEIERDSQTQSKRIKEQEESKHKKGAFRIGCGRARLFFHLFMNSVQIFILRLPSLLIIFNNCVLCFIVWII